MLEMSDVDDIHFVACKTCNTVLKKGNSKSHGRVRPIAIELVDVMPKKFLTLFDVKKGIVTYNTPHTTKLMMTR